MTTTKNVCFADVFISRCSQSGNEQGGTKEGYLVGTGELNYPNSAEYPKLQQCRPKCLLLNGTSLSAAAQTTLYYLTIPTEGYLTWWTPFATRPTPTSAIQKVLTLTLFRIEVFANYVHSPVCHFVPQRLAVFPSFSPKLFLPLVHFITSCILTAPERESSTMLFGKNVAGRWKECLGGVLDNTWCFA